MTDLKHTHDNYPAHTRTVKDHNKYFGNKQDKKLEDLKLYSPKKEEEVLEPNTNTVQSVHFGPYVKVTKVFPQSKVEENEYGLDLFILNDVEVRPGSISVAKTGVLVEVPYGYVGLVTLDDEIAKSGVFMTNSPMVVMGKKDLELYLTTLESNWFMFRQGRKIGNIVFYKLETLNYEYTNV